MFANLFTPSLAKEDNDFRKKNIDDDENNYDDVAGSAQYTVAPR